LGPNGTSREFPAKIQKHEMQGYKDLGAAGVITKPFNPMTLPRELQRTIDAEPAL